MVAALIIVVGVALVAFLYWYLNGPGAPGGPARSVVAEFSGVSDQTTNTFQVREGWQIHWETEGDRFAFAITGDLDFGTVIEEEGPGSGITSPVPSGSFRLEITAEGPWSVTIIQGD